MDDLDRKMRRVLLSPLARRSQRTFDTNSFMEALTRLDDRAVGEAALKQLRDVLSGLRDKKDARIWKNPDGVAESVALAKVLYSSRRISTHEYVFYASAPVEGVHDGRALDGEYEELASITEAMKMIEEEHGLKSDEYWLLPDAPEEYGRLSRQYDVVYKTKLLETLREFGLDDLADLKERNSAKFDRLRERGRRSVHHRDEYAFAIRDIVVRYEKEARRAAEVGAYSAAVTSLGAGVEGLLLLRCLRSRHKASRISKSLQKRLRPRFRDDPTTWTFETLIEVCLEAGWLPPVETSVAWYDSADLAHALRLMRNHVHPGKHARVRPWSETDKRDYQDADAIYVVLLSTLGKVRRAKTKDSPQ